MNVRVPGPYILSGPKVDIGLQLVYRYYIHIITYFIPKVFKMPTFGIDAFLQPVPDTHSHSATQIPMRTNFLKRIFDEILQLLYCDRFSGINLIL